MQTLRIVLMLALTWTMWSAPLPLSAQVMLSTGAATEAPPSLPDPLTPEAANALISRLSDAQVRQLLLDQLHTQAEDTAKPEAGLSEFFYHATSGAASSITSAIALLPNLYSGQMGVFATFYERMGPQGLLRLAGYLALIFAAGIAAELLFRRFTRKWHSLPPPAAQELNLGNTLRSLFQRLCHQILAVVVFIVVARSFGEAILPADLIPLVSLIGFYLIGFAALCQRPGTVFDGPG